MDVDKALQQIDQVIMQAINLETIGEFDKSTDTWNEASKSLIELMKQTRNK